MKKLSALFLLVSMLFLVSKTIHAQKTTINEISTASGSTGSGFSSNSLGLSTSSKDSIWKSIDVKDIPVLGKRLINPIRFQTFVLNLEKLKLFLQNAPLEGTGTNSLGHVLSFPIAEGKFVDFSISNSPIMEKALSDKFPEINTYSGVATDNSGMSVRLDLTPQGFHAMIMIPGESTVYIDPFTFGGGDITHYIVYKRTDFRTDKKMDCQSEAKGNPNSQRLNPDVENSFLRSYSTCSLKTFRLALAATAEYTTFQGGTVALALAAQVTTMNRVNGIFMRDFSVKMNIVANNNLLIYTNATTDPYTNGDAAAMLTQNQTRVTTVIGSANFDIGHVFGTNSGGIAGLGVVCNSSYKAQGVTGSGSPVGDPFDIDYVAHEMGHQFGGNHTFNSDLGSCGGGNRNDGTAYENGSGITIMAYAGICSPSDVASNSIDHFHGGSLAEMGSFISTLTCPVSTALANSSPVITNDNATKVIPKGTLFSLTASATDVNSNTLTYCWEEIDNGIPLTQPPLSTEPLGSMFRPYSPSTSPTRYFPKLSDVLANTVSPWEVLPTTSRTLKFRLTVRDNASGGGCADIQDQNVEINSTTGPFILTFPTATAISLAGNTNQAITWNPAGTAGAPVNCTYVDILLSTDGGLTYPTTLASNTPNDGSHIIMLPNLSTSTARVMVKAINNIFFDISDNNFAITAATVNDFTLSLASTTPSSCKNLNNATYSINVGKLFTFNSAVTLSTSGLPSGATASFSNNSTTPNFSSVLTIANLSAVANGFYEFNIIATSGSVVKQLVFQLAVNGPSEAPVLTSPTNNAVNQSWNSTLTWTPPFSNLPLTYDLEIAIDQNFSNIFTSATSISSNAYVISNTSLQSNSVYFWRVKSNNACGYSPYSAVFSFSTSSTSCLSKLSANVPVTINPGAPNSITSVIPISFPAYAKIIDVNVVNLTGTHTYVGDLNIKLKSPTGTEIVLLNRICNTAAYIDFNIKFDNSGSLYSAIPCPPTNGGTYIPVGSLASFNGQNPSGNWVLTVADLADGDGGSLNSWGLEICVEAPIPTITSISPAFGTTIPGTTVTITGTNFNTTAASNIVKFGATKAVVSAATASSLTVTAPAGATYEPITVLNTSSVLMAASKKFFLSTFSPNKGDLTLNDILPKVDFATTGTQQPYYVAIGDVDGDGKPDLAVANYANGTVSLFRNTSTSGTISSASFAAKVDFATGTNPISIAIGDLDGDGKPELAVVNYGSANISVFRNTSSIGVITSASFATKVDYTTGTNPRSVAIGDLDGDGKPDLVIANATSSTVSILRNASLNGIISFLTKVDYTTGSAPHFVAIGDLDGDGKLDLTTANNGSASVSALRNISTLGTISFQTKVDFTAGNSPVSVAIGDLNADGKPELTVTNFSDANLSVFQNNSTSGAITTASFATKVDFSAGVGAWALAIGDLDGDGKPDLAVANGGVASVSVLRNTTTASSITSSSFASKVDFATATATRSLAIGDLDLDGKADLVAANYSTASISVFRNNPTYSITYDGNTNTSGTVSAISYSSIVTTATVSANSGNLIKTGYTFAGWNTIANGSGTSYAATGNASFTINANVTLYAQWTLNNYMITFDANGGTGTMSNQSIAYLASANLITNTFTRTGYTFAGWATTSGGTVAYANGASYTMSAASNVTLYAKWIINIYTFTFDATPSSQNICSNNAFTTIVLNPNVSEVVYYWVRNNTASITGIAASGSGDISGTLTNTTNFPITVTFTITPTNNGLEGTPITATIVVNPKPTVSVVASSSTICDGGSTSLTGSGASTYLWNPGGLTGASVTVSPSTTTTYAVDGTNTFGCTTTANVMVTVKSNPSFALTSSNTSTCTNSPVTISADFAYAASASYCTTFNNYPDYCFVKNVTFGTINSDNTNYQSNVPNTNYQTTVVHPGETHTLIVATDNNYPADVGVWIDYNRNGIYESSEYTEVYQDAITGSVNITIPPNASIGKTGMRIRSDYMDQYWVAFNSGSACGDVFYGTTQDYTITIGQFNTFSWSSNPVDASLSNVNTGSITPSPAVTTNYTVVVTNTFGCSSTSTLNMAVNPCTTTLNVTTFLEGFYTGNGTIRANLYDLGISTNPTETDSVEVNLWSATNLSSATPDYSVRAVLHINGTLTAVFPGATLNNSYYVALKHRNSIEIWSAEPLTIASITNYDFSSSLNAAYSDGFNDAMKWMNGNKYAMFGGDVNQDGTIDLFDAQITDNGAANLLFGYDESDCNGDGSTDLFDLQLIDNNSMLLLFYARPY